MVMWVGSFLPFQTTYYLNGHDYNYIAGELQRRGVRFRKDDNAFLGLGRRRTAGRRRNSGQRSAGNALADG